MNFAKTSMLCLTLLISSTGIYGIVPSSQQGIQGKARLIARATAQELSKANGIKLDAATLSKRKAVRAEHLKKRKALVKKSVRSIKSPNFGEKAASATSSLFSGNPVQQLGLNFTAATNYDTKNYTALPNQNGWVGKKQYIMISYDIIRSFDKKTGLPDGVLDIDASSFFGSIVAEDVRIDYDRFTDRWFMSCENLDVVQGIPTTIFLAMSDSGTITECTKWSIFAVDNQTIIPEIPIAEGPGALDYNQLALDENAVYIGVGTFNNAETVFLGTSYIVFEKSSLLAGSPDITVFPGLNGNAEGFEVFGPPADNFDAKPKFGYLISPNILAPNFIFANQLFLWRTSNTDTTSPTIFGPITIDIPSFTGTSSGAPFEGNLFGVTWDLQTGDIAPAAPHVRNGKMYVCTDIQTDASGTPNLAGDRIGILWFVLDLSGGTGVETVSTVPTVIQWGVVFDTDQTTTTPKNYFNSSIMTNKLEDIIISGSVSGLADFPNVFYTSRKKTDPFGQMRKIVTVTNSNSTFNSGPSQFEVDGFLFVQRWGDLSSLSPEPCNDLDVWSTQQFTVGQNAYGTQAFQLKPCITAANTAKK